MKKIIINHIAKIEGHGSFSLNVARGEIQKARFQVLEGARFIEGILIGRSFKDVPLITSRICGICSVAHHLASTKAIENALKIKITAQAERLRKLLCLSEIIQSHAAHIFFLCLGDFFKMDSDLDLIKNYPDLSKNIIFIRDFSNKLKELVGGRDMHLLSSCVGGFTKTPSERNLKEIQKLIEPALSASLQTMQFIKSMDYPKYSREVEFISLASKNEYALYDGRIASSKGLNLSPSSFYSQVEEIQRLDPVKEVRLNKNTFMVGALSRINNHFSFLNKEAKKFLFPSLPNYNIFHNIYAQNIEVIHAIEEAEKIIKEYLKDKSRKVYTKFSLKNGEGVGVIEAPRGPLYHFYKFSKYGIIKEANIVTPTAQFLPNLENDLNNFLNKNKELSLSEKKRRIKMMIRAYDLCLTCATH